jgi:hypothetical protein
MSYRTSALRELTISHPTWENLDTYLASPEGGTIRSVGEGRYRILRYTKGISDLSLPHTKWMRSVVWDTQENRPVCVAPPKAEKGEPVSGGIGCTTEDFLDGMMINVFRTAEKPDELQIATRSQIGAGGKFYSEKSFAHLFEEALVAMKFTKAEILSQMVAVGEQVPASFVSFVLQHPEHRVVSRCKSPHLWIVHSGTVSQSGDVSINERCVEWPVRFQIPSYPTGSFESLCQEKGWFFQGIVVKDGKGNRWRLRNPNYLYLRSLRGSEASSLERFVRLRSESKVTEYLKHYSEDRQAFWDLEQRLRAKTQEVFQSYCDVHKARTKVLKDLDKAIQPCVFKLHSHYLEHLRPNTETVSMKHAVELVNNLPLFEQKRLLVPTGSLVAAAMSLAAAAVCVNA